MWNNFIFCNYEAIIKQWRFSHHLKFRALPHLSSSYVHSRQLSSRNRSARNNPNGEAGCVKINVNERNTPLKFSGWSSVQRFRWSRVFPTTDKVDDDRLSWNQQLAGPPAPSTVSCSWCLISSDVSLEFLIKLNDW